MFKKMDGLPNPYLGMNRVPFSLTYPVYVGLNGQDVATRLTMDVPHTLENEMYVFQLCNDRTFFLRERMDGYEDMNFKLLTAQGQFEHLYVIDIDHVEEKVFGYNADKGQFFRVGMKQSGDDAFITVDGKRFPLSEFMR